MGFCIRRGSLVLSTALLLAFGSAAQAAPVHYDFTGECFGTEGSGCAAYGLNEGDLVSGTLTIDSSLVNPGGSTEDIHLDPGTAFSFTFGNQEFDLDDLSDSFIDVSFNADGTVLTCLNGLLGCPNDPTDYAGFNNGLSETILPNGAELRAFYNFVQIIANTDVPKNQFAQNGVGPGNAGAKGQWVAQDPSNPIPEPSAALLFAVGSVVVYASRKRAQR